MVNFCLNLKLFDPDTRSHKVSVLFEQNVGKFNFQYQKFYYYVSFQNFAIKSSQIFHHYFLQILLS